MTLCTPKPAAGSKQNERIKISIVDDDQSYGFVMQRTVERSRDLECVGLYNLGVEALKGITSSACEVVLVDVCSMK